MKREFGRKSRVARVVAFAVFAACATAVENEVSKGERDESGRTASVPAESRPAHPQSVVNAMVVASPAVRMDPGFNTESYGHFVENVFLSPVSNPLSTFSIDVDRASWSNVRRFIAQGSAPPIDAVRIEELINYFPYTYADPNGEHPFAVTTELAPAPWAPRHHLLRIGLQGERVAVESLPPSNLVLLVDVSGSMQTPDKLPLLKQAMGLLVDAMREEDRIAIVAYAGAAGLVLPATSGDRKDEIMNAINGLEAGGSTAGGEGLRLAYRVARENFRESGNNRVILATDGDFNVGESSDAAMIRLIEEQRGDGIFLTVLGFGTGNLKDSKMESIADHGNGNYAYIDGLAEARKVLVQEMGGTLLTIAKDVKLQVEFNPAHVQAYRLIGYENRLLAAEDFNDDAKDAGDMGAGHTVTALYEIVPAGSESDVEIRGVDSLRYRRPSVPVSRGGNELGFIKLRYKQPSGPVSTLLTHTVSREIAEPSTDFTFASAVAAFGMILRDSPHRGSATLDQVLALASDGMGFDEGGHRGAFVRTVERYRSIANAVAASNE